MKACVFVLGAILLAGASAQNPAAKSIVPQTQQEHFLAKANAGNFACKVQSVTVSTVNPGIQNTVAKLHDDILQKFSYVATLEWAHIAQTSFASSDGRNDEKVLATPGGDMGEFIQVLNAYTKVSNKILAAEEVSALFEKYLKIMTREKFFYETDERAYLSIAVATGCRNLRVAEMGGLRHKRDAYLSVIATPEYIGDAFIRFMATNATDLGLVPDYIHHALAAYHKVLWTNPSEKAKKLCYLEMKGKHEHVALVNILTPTFCVDQGLAPMASQQFSSIGPVLLNHPEAVKIFRRELVSIFDYNTEPKVDPRDVLAAFNELAQNNLERYWYQVGADLPIFDVEFLNNSPLLAEEVTFVSPQ